MLSKRQRQVNQEVQVLTKYKYLSSAPLWLNHNYPSVFPHTFYTQTENSNRSVCFPFTNSAPTTVHHHPSSSASINDPKTTPWPPHQPALPTAGDARPPLCLRMGAAHGPGTRSALPKMTHRHLPTLHNLGMFLVTAFYRSAKRKPEAAWSSFNTLLAGKAIIRGA